MFYYFCVIRSCYERTKETRYFAAENTKDILAYINGTLKENYLSKWEFIALEDYYANEADYPNSDEAWEEFCDSFTYEDFVESYHYTLTLIHEDEAIKQVAKIIRKGM